MSYLSEKRRELSAGRNAQRKDALERLNAKSRLSDKDERLRKKLIGQIARADAREKIASEKATKPIIDASTKTTNKSVTATVTANSHNTKGVNGNSLTFTEKSKPKKTKK